MSAEETLKFFHLLLVFTFFAGTMVASVASGWAARAKDVATVRTLIAMAKTISIALIYPSIIALSVVGVFLADKQGWDLNGPGWLNAAYTSVVIGFVLGLGVLGRNGIRLQKLADRDAPTGQISTELRSALDAPMPKIVGGLLHALVIYILVLMVFKPYD
jgi:uncharacterized membrane protein